MPQPSLKLPGEPLCNGQLCLVEGKEVLVADRNVAVVCLLLSGCQTTKDSQVTFMMKAKVSSGKSLVTEYTVYVKGNIIF